MNKNLKIILPVIIILLILAWVIFFRFSTPSVQVVFPQEKEVLQSIAATGTVKAIYEAIISSEIPGIIKSIPKDKGGKVKKGEAVIFLKDDQYIADLEHAQAVVSQAQAGLEKVLTGTEKEIIEAAMAKVAGEQAKVSGAGADLETSQIYYSRLTALEEQVNIAKSGRDMAEARLKDLKAKLEDLLNGPRPEEIKSAEARVESAKAFYDQAKADMERAKKLYEEGAVSRQEYEFAETKVEDAQALLDSARSSLDLLLNSPTDEEVKQGEAAVEEAEAALTGAESSLANAIETYEDKLDARKQLDFSKTNYEVSLEAYKAAQKELENLLNQPLPEDAAAAQANLEQALAGLEGAKARLDAATIVSPIEGVILERFVDPGQGIATGTPLLRIVDEKNLEVVVDFDEKKLAEIKISQPVYITLDAYPEKTFEGKVSEIAPSINAEAGTVEVKIDFSEIPDFVKPDMTADVNILTSGKENSLTIPKNCVIFEGNNEWVMVVIDGTAKKVEINVGAAGTEIVEVLSGISSTDRVILNPFDVKDGSKVKAVEVER